MKGNEIIADIHRHREQLTRACGYDVKKLMDYYRRREKEDDKAGQKLVSYVTTPSAENVSSVLLDEPPKKKGE